MGTTRSKKPYIGSEQGDASTYIVTLKAKVGGYCLYVERFGEIIDAEMITKPYLRHTTRIEEACRYTRARAEEVAQRISKEGCRARVEVLSKSGESSNPLLTPPPVN
jgi:hypothetical protein